MRVQVRREDDCTDWHDGNDRLAYVWIDDVDYDEWSWCILDTAEDYTAEGSSTTREGAERDVAAILRGRGYTVEDA